MVKEKEILVKREWDDEVRDAVEIKKAWLDYKASGKDKSMREIKTE